MSEYLFYDRGESAEGEAMFVLPCDDSTSQLHHQAARVLELTAVRERGPPTVRRLKRPLQVHLSNLKIEQFYFHIYIKILFCGFNHPPPKFSIQKRSTLNFTLFSLHSCHLPRRVCFLFHKITTSKFVARTYSASPKHTPQAYAQPDTHVGLFPI